MTKIAQLFRYPVKSLLGETLTEATLSTTGIPGDRAWAVRDAKGTKGGKKFPQLMSARARLLGTPSTHNPSPPVVIELPDGRSAASTSNGMNPLLSDYLDAPVTLWPIVDAANLAHYRRQAMSGEPSAQEAALRAVFGRLAHEPLPDFSQFPAELIEHESPPGTYFDAYPLLLLSRASLDSLARLAPASNYDVQRFRPNILLDELAGDFPENQWVGNLCQIGEVELRIEMACPRCIMTTHAFGELPKDPRIMRALVAHNNGNLGVYASIVRGGKIKPGDAVTIRPDPDRNSSPKEGSQT